MSCSPQRSLSVPSSLIEWFVHGCRRHISVICLILRNERATVPTYSRLVHLVVVHVRTVATEETTICHFLLRCHLPPTAVDQPLHHHHHDEDSNFVHPVDSISYCCGRDSDRFRWLSLQISWCPWCKWRTLTVEKRTLLHLWQRSTTHYSTH